MEESVKNLYEEELSAIKPCTEEEMAALFEKLQNGDAKAESRLLEGNLYRVIEAANYFENEQVPAMDLIQEGNMALLLAIRGVKKYGKDTDAIFNIAIRGAMEDYLAQEEDSNKAAEELKVKLNVIDEVCIRLADELGREATADEVAAKINMDVDDVKYLMRIALSAINKDKA